MNEDEMRILMELLGDLQATMITACAQAETEEMMAKCSLVLNRAEDLNSALFRWLTGEYM